MKALANVPPVWPSQLQEPARHPSASRPETWDKIGWYMAKRDPLQSRRKGQSAIEWQLHGAAGCQRSDMELRRLVNVEPRLAYKTRLRTAVESVADYCDAIGESVPDPGIDGAGEAVLWLAHEMRSGVRALCTSRGRDHEATLAGIIHAAFDAGRQCALLQAYAWKIGHYAGRGIRVEGNPKFARRYNPDAQRNVAGIARLLDKGMRLNTACAQIARRRMEGASPDEVAREAERLRGQWRTRHKTRC